MPEKVKKRNGIVVDFDASKVKAAIAKAFFATRGGVEPELLDKLATQVMDYVEQRYANKVPSVEDVQNLVESVLMSGGYFDVAKAYIIYRYEHSKIREEEGTEETGPSIYVVKRSGQRQRFSLDKIKDTLRRATKGFEEEVDINLIAIQCQSDVYDGIPTTEIYRAAVFATRALIENDPAYSKVASRLLTHQVYRDVIGEERFDEDSLDEIIRRVFVENTQRAVEAGKLDRRMLDFDLKRLADGLDLKRDDLFMYLGTQTLYDRYLLEHPETMEKLETPQAFWMRVAMGLAINESDKNEWALKFYDNISSLRFVPSTPTLFHAGTTHPQLSSCYLTTVEDSLEHIFKCIGDNAMLSKWSGGLGNDWTNLRGTGALIKGTGVESQGAIPFLKVANDTTAAINRSGRRRGATCAYMEVWHYDIEAFAELRKNTGDERRRTHDMDTAAWIPDLFMKRVKENGEWTLFSPDETPDLHHIYGRKFEERYAEYERLAKEGKIRLFKTMRAQDLWKKLLSMLFETGHPWITFKDPSNVRSPQDHAGVIHSSNLCTEITLNTSAEETAVCNLGSVNLAKHVTADGLLNQELIKDTVTTAMRMLDNVVDANFYPTIEAKNSNMKHRPIGLGVMGFQDALYLRNIDFASPECVKFADESMEAISYHAIMASSQLAKERGAYQSYHGSKWERGILPQDTIDILEDERGVKINVDRGSILDWTPVREHIKQYGMRNSNTMAVAPTATISNIAGCIPTIEPIYKNIYVKSNQGGDFIVVNQYLVDDLKKLGLWSDGMLKKLKYLDGNISGIEEIPITLRNKYKETFDISPEWLIKAAAARGKWIDQSQSLNIYYAGSSGGDISKIYLYAWEMGLKTTYYLRTLAASQVEKSTVSTAEFGATHLRKKGEAADAVSEQPAEGAEEEAAVAPTEEPVPAPAEEPTAPVTNPVYHDLPPSTFGETVTNADASAQNDIKLCRIDDPNCEACQ